MKPGIKHIAFWAFNNIYVMLESKYQEKKTFAKRWNILCMLLIF